MGKEGELFHAHGVEFGRFQPTGKPRGGKKQNVRSAGKAIVFTDQDGVTRASLGNQTEGTGGKKVVQDWPETGKTKAIEKARQPVIQNG